MKTFREWLREKEARETTQVFKNAKEYLGIFESFDTHYDIDKIYLDNRHRMCYNFKVNDLYYRVFIQRFLNDKIHIGFEKRDSYFSNRWSTYGFENKLENGQIQKLFGTVIYVVNKLYNVEFSYLFIHSEEPKKFNLYFMIAKQIHNKLLPESRLDYDNDTICISKKDAKVEDISKIETKYLKDK